MIAFTNTILPRELDLPNPSSSDGTHRGQGPEIRLR